MDSNFYIAVSVTALVVVILTAGSAHAILSPSDLNLGDPYQLVFVTRDGRIGTDSNIAVYNDHVQNQAEKTGAMTEDYGVNWFAIVSTENVDAIDNVPDNPNVPVYRFDSSDNMNLIKVADATDSLFDANGTLLSPINVDQFGNMQLSQNTWTGSDIFGKEKTDRALGNSTSNLARVGFVNNQDALWIDNSNFPKTSVFRLYALSQQLTVLPPAGACDFNDDSVCGLGDVNEMFKQGDLTGAGVSVIVGNKYDLDSDLDVDEDDITEWLRLAGSSRGYGGGDPNNPNAPFLRGDTDHLNKTFPAPRTIDITDFQNFLVGFTGIGSTWEVGNFNGDGGVDITDFSNHFLLNFVATSGGTYGPNQSVPEPDTILLLGLGGAFGVFLCVNRIN